MVANSFGDVPELVRRVGAAGVVERFDIGAAEGMLLDWPGQAYRLGEASSWLGRAARFVPRGLDGVIDLSGPGWNQPRLTDRAECGRGVACDVTEGLPVGRDERIDIDQLA